MTDLHDAEDFWAEFAKAGGSQTEMAERVGVPRTTIRDIKQHHEAGRVWAYGAWRKPGSIQLVDAKGNVLDDVESLADPVDPESAVEQDRLELRLKSELTDLRRKYSIACATGNLYEDILAVAREVMGKVKPSVVPAPKIGASNTHEDAMLAWADWHGGEVVDYDVMLGYNAYNPTIMCRRAQYTVDHTLSILYDTQRGTTFDRLYVIDLGDSINGDHLPEQMATNALPVFEAMRMVTAVKSQALTELSAHIPVTYIIVPGNHGRRGQKMQWKLPTETADWLIGEMIADRVRGNDRIECVIPKAWTAGLTVRGQNHVLNHGFTAAKGGFGGISWYSFQRADGQKTATEAAHGKRVHHRWYGHIHQKAEIPMTDGEGEQHIIGSLKGGDEYALEGLNRYSDAVQKLVGCHDEYGVTWRYPLNVSHGDEKPSRYEELL
jgi:hypothetical protein